MPVDQKGKEVLKAAGYRTVRRDISKAVAEYTRDQGRAGEDLYSIVERILGEEKFRKFFEGLIRRTMEATKLTEKESKRCASMLVGEETYEDLRRVPGLVYSDREARDGKMEKIFTKSRRKGLVKGRYERRGILRAKPGVLCSLVELFRDNPILWKIVGIGIFLILTSAFLLGSFYDALIVALTLNAIPAPTLILKLGNILGAIGGVLIFFTSIALVLSHLMEKERTRELMHRLAEKYLEMA